MEDNADFDFPGRQYNGSVEDNNVVMERQVVNYFKGRKNLFKFDEDKIRQIVRQMLSDNSKTGLTDITNYIEYVAKNNYQPPMRPLPASLMPPSALSEKALREAREWTPNSLTTQPNQNPLSDDRDESPERMVEQPSMLSRARRLFTRRLPPCVGSLCPESNLKRDGGRRRSRRARKSKKSRRRFKK